MVLILAIFIAVGFIFVAVSIFSNSNQESKESIENSKPEENLQTLVIPVMLQKEERPMNW